MRSKARTLSLSLALGLIAAGAAHAACPTGAFLADLKIGAVLLNTIPGQVSVTTSGASVCGAAREAVLKIDLLGSGATCTRANIVAEWEGLPKDWTLNIGDSPTNNGFAGDSGTTVNDAELWILNERMSIANNGLSPDNPLYGQDLSLTDSSLAFVVKNQYVSWGQPYSFLQTPASKQLFALPDNDAATAASEKGSKIYVGLNRVVDSITGAASLGRRGCGLRRVMVTLQ